MDLHQERELRRRHRNREGRLPISGRLDRTGERALTAQADLTRMLFGAHRW